MRVFGDTHDNIKRDCTTSTTTTTTAANDLLIDDVRKHAFKQSICYTLFLLFLDYGNENKTKQKVNVHVFELSAQLTMTT